ncbi:MAG TPA: LysR substrate-binding domain-containing protein [Hypericibacter adhaerens]|uniref:LysR substrate-binding domain-containing protein n=1 Tax=Hypericibacter adhaerens TaxID=2602016 RepID=UPI002BD4CA00|nr:LysR substrate-binding domain-containing protein [Hypericibacter adhaerens]HWA42844.1 LysR substrate-binding domain-containing protein [Hypericibacter adhaerens]
MRYGRAIPPLKSLLAIEAAARFGSFSKAAAELNVTQSAVSHLVGQAEAYLGARLFDRASRPMRLTREGQRYVSGVVSGLNILKAEGQHLQERKKAQSTLIVSCNLGYGNFWLLPKLRHFHERHPAITVNMVTTYQGLPELTDGIDVAIRFGKGDWPDCRSQLLYRERIVPVASVAYVEQAARIRHPKDLLKHTLLHAHAIDRSWFDWNQWFDHFGVACPSRLPGPGFDNHVLMMQAALTGSGVALGWKGTAGDFVRKRQLVEALPDPIDVDGGLYLVTHRDTRPSRALGSFADWLLEQAAADR